MPPRVDLAGLEQIGIVTFRASDGTGLGDLATQRFVESARRDQGLVRTIDLGTSPTPENDVALGRERGVRTVLAGDLTVSKVRPEVRVASDLASGGVAMSLEATLAVRMVEVGTGASIWSRSARATRSVRNVGVFGGKEVLFDAADPEGAYAQRVDDLVAQVTADFHARWERR